MRKTGLLLLVIIATLIGSCVKETYDMNRLSEKMRISPTFAVSAATGQVTLGNIVKPNDTIIYDDDDLLKLWIRKDSVAEIGLDSLIDLSEAFSFTGSYPVGEIKIENFTSQYQITLGQLSDYFIPSLWAEFQALDDGSPHPFPEFPLTNTGTHTFTSFSNFEYAVFSGGRIHIDITNNLPAPLTGLSITLKNGDDNSPVGGTITTGTIVAGSTWSTFIEMSDTRVYSTVTAEIVFNGSPGTTDPVIISMSDQILFELSGEDLEVSSGRFVVPLQRVGESGSEEMVDFDLDDDMEITEFSLSTGIIDVEVTSSLTVHSEFSVVLPTITRSGLPFAESISVNPMSVSSGSYSANNLLALLNTNPLQPYNSAPAQYEVWISSQGAMIDFSSLDRIDLTASVRDLDIGYVKGYFGQLEETLEPDTIDLEIQDILDKITGEFYFANPSLTFSYSNSFGLPVEISLEATGKNRDKTAGLNLSPFILDYPVSPVDDIESLFTIDRNNSSLPTLISLPPSSIVMSGAAKINPAGNTGLRDNYVSGDSRFVASIEAMLPMDIWINNLQFADTLDNFLKPETDDDEEFSPEDLDYVRLDLMVENGFPLGLSVQIVLHDSVTGTDLYTLDVPGIIDPAEVSTSTGRVTSPVEKTTPVELEKSFFEAAETADKMILVFTLNTTNSPSQSVKIYSDYSISFKAGIVVKPDIILN
jgi:hypothetical protein